MSSSNNKVPPFKKLLRKIAVFLQFTSENFLWGLNRKENIPTKVICLFSYTIMIHKVYCLSSLIEKELERIEQIIFQGKYTEAIEDIAKILENEKISKENKIRAFNLRSLIDFYFADSERLPTALALAKEAHKESLEINNLVLLFFSSLFLKWFYYRSSMYKESIEVSPSMDEIFEKVSLANPEEAKKLEPLILILRALNPTIRAFLGEPVPENYLEKATKLTEKAYELADERNLLFPKIGAINNLVGYYRRSRRMEEHHNSILKYLEIEEELGNKYGIAQGYRLLGFYHYNKGEYEEFLDYLNRRLKIFEELKYVRGISVLNYEMGEYYISQRNYDKALDCFEKVLDYFLDKNDIHEISGSYQNIGYVYTMKGDLHKALKYTEKGHNIISEKKIEGWWHVLPSLAAINLLIGNIDEALQYEEEFLNLHKKTEYTLAIAFSLSRISSIYWQQGLESEAINSAQESLKLLEETDNLLWIGNVLADLVFFSTEKSDLEQAKKYLNKLEKVNLEKKDSILNQRYNFSEAIILAKSENERDRMKASLILENLLREKLDYAFHVKVLLTLSELFITNLQKTGDTENLIKLQKHVLDLYSLASTNKSYILTAETLLLQSKLALVELDYEKAESLLDQAFNIAEEKGLDRLKESIKKEREIFKEEKQKIENFDKETSIQEKIEAVDFKSRMNGAKKASLSIKQSGEQIMLKSLF